MEHTFIRSTVLAAAVGMMLMFGTGCPPPGDNIDKVIAKALSGGCGGCEGCEPGEGEGEGETPEEGEGEIAAEGEGEAPAEGEAEGEGEGEHEGETQTVVLPADVILEMVWIPSGTFQMGRYAGEQDSYADEDPQHSVSVPGFWLGKYEVTKRQWQALMDTAPWTGRAEVLDYPDSPAVYVSWYDAQDFVTALHTYTGEPFRLPSEAEWEYACRSGTGTRFYWGDDPAYTVIRDYGWSFNIAWFPTEPYAHLVGGKLPNAWGLHDMSGNAWEWCEDDWHAGYTGAPADGSAWVDSPRGANRVRRGGCWKEGDYRCRSAYHYITLPSEKTSTYGFRLARTD